MLQVGGNRAYLYETQSYSQLFSDIEFMIEKNPETRFTLITRIPSRRLLEQLDINGLDTYWMTEQDTNNSIKPDFSSVVEIFRQSKDASNEQVMVIDGLEFISDRIGADQLLTEITILVDDLSKFNYTCILCLDLLAMPAKIATKLKYILETLEISNEKVLVTGNEDEEYIRVLAPFDTRSPLEQEKFHDILGDSVFHHAVIHVTVDDPVPTGSPLATYLADLKLKPYLHFQ